MAVTWKVEADFDRDGTYEEDLTPRIDKTTAGLTIQRGMSPDGVYQISQLSLGIANRDGRYTPENTSSPLHGKLEPGIPVRVIATHNSIQYTLWSGYIQRISNEWQVGRGAIARLRAVDLADYLRAYNNVNVTSSTTRKTDDALNAICDAIGLSASLRQFDAGQQSLPLHFARMQNALRACMDVVKSEMGGFLWVTKDGKLRFESRASRLGTTVDHTWGDGTNIKPYRARYEANNDDFICRVTVRATILQQGQDEVEVFRFSRGVDNRPADSLRLAPGEVYEAEFHYAAPVITLATPVARRDYLANSAIDGSGTDMTDDLDVTVTHLGAGFALRLENTHASTPLYVTRFRLRGTVDSFVADRPHFVAAKSVPGLPTDAGVDIDLPFADDSGRMPAHYSIALLRTYRYPIPRLVLDFFLDRHDDIAASLLSAEIGDLVHYKDQALGWAQVDDWWYIESIQYRTHVGRVTEAEVMLVPSYAYRNLDAIAYDLFTRSGGSGLGQALSGQDWATEGSASWAIYNNQARALGSGDGVAYLALGSSDCVVEVDVDSGDLTQGGAGVVYRRADANNYYRAWLDFQNGLVVLEKVVAGTPSTIASASLTLSLPMELRAMAQGSRHRIWVDRKLYIDAADSAISGTTAGMFAGAVKITGILYDDFYAQGL